jgi:hypothetical protein
MDPWMVIAGIVAMAAGYVGVLAVLALVRARRHWAVCPETGRIVEVCCAKRDAVAGVFDGRRQRVVACSRWPERGGCDRACERDIAP